LYDNLKKMKKRLYIIIFVLSFVCIEGRSQSPHFVLLPATVSTQIKGKANDSLSLFYKCVYIGTTTAPTFTGVIYTNYNTNINKNPAIARDSFNTAAQIPPDTINNLDTIPFYCHIPVTQDYFKNGKANLIVIWPTGARQKTGIVTSSDTFHYATTVAISGFTGIDEKDDPFGTLNIYPNPANSYLNINNPNPELVLNLIRIMDNTGRLVMQSHDNFERIDISVLKPGTYYLELNSTDGNSSVYPFMINR